MIDWVKKAFEIGFSEAGSLDATTLKPMKEVRDMCAADQCHAYGKNWTCPPVCGTLEECTERIQKFHSGILVQTVGEMDSDFDVDTMFETEQKHLESFHTFCDLIREKYPDALCLGTGGCRICKQCAYPEACRFPKRACSSMEGYGLLVTQVCTDNQIKYYHGKGTITYTACILFA